MWRLRQQRRAAQAAAAAAAANPANPPPPVTPAVPNLHSALAIMPTLDGDEFTKAFKETYDVVNDPNTDDKTICHRLVGLQ